MWLMSCKNNYKNPLLFHTLITLISGLQCSFYTYIRLVLKYHINRKITHLLPFSKSFSKSCSLLCNNLYVLISKYTITKLFRKLWSYLYIHFPACPCCLCSKLFSNGDVLLTLSLHPTGPHLTGYQKNIKKILSEKYSHPSEFWKKQKNGHQTQYCSSFPVNLLS